MWIETKRSAFSWPVAASPSLNAACPLQWAGGVSGRKRLCHHGLTASPGQNEHGRFLQWQP